MAVSKHRKKTKQRHKKGQGISTETIHHKHYKALVLSCLDAINAPVSGQYIMDETGLDKVAAVAATKALIKEGKVVQHNLFWFKRVRANGTLSDI